MDNPVNMNVNLNRNMDLNVNISWTALGERILYFSVLWNLGKNLWTWLHILDEIITIFLDLEIPPTQRCGGFTIVVLSWSTCLVNHPHLCQRDLVYRGHRKANLTSNRCFLVNHSANILRNHRGLETARRIVKIFEWQFGDAIASAIWKVKKTSMKTSHLAWENDFPFPEMSCAFLPGFKASVVSCFLLRRRISNTISADSTFLGFYSMQLSVPMRAANCDCHDKPPLGESPSMRWPRFS